MSARLCVQRLSGRITKLLHICSVETDKIKDVPCKSQFVIVFMVKTSRTLFQVVQVTDRFLDTLSVYKEELSASSMSRKKKIGAHQSNSVVIQ